jgi:hypothetical protein
MKLQCGKQQSLIDRTITFLLFGHYSVSGHNNILRLRVWMYLCLLERMNPLWNPSDKANLMADDKYGDYESRKCQYNFNPGNGQCPKRMLP